MAAKNFAIIYEHVLFFYQDTVSWDFVTCTEEDNVTNDQFSRIDFLHGAVLSTDSLSLRLLGDLEKRQKFVVFSVVAASLDSGSQRDSHEN